MSNVEDALQKLQNDLHRLATWRCENDLLINPDKTKFLLIGTRQQLNKLEPTPSLSFLGKRINPVPSAKDLGVSLDPNLTYNNHIANVAPSCFSKLCQSNRVRSSFDSKTLNTLVNSLVFNKMTYCSSVWANTSASNINKLQLIQNFGCKIVTNTKKFEHVMPLLHQLNWLTVKDTLIFRDLVLMYKCLNKMAPSYLREKFSKRSEIHERQTRQSDSLVIYKSAAGQRTFCYRAVHYWNNLD